MKLINFKRLLTRDSIVASNEGQGGTFHNTQSRQREGRYKGLLLNHIFKDTILKMLKRDLNSNMVKFGHQCKDHN